MHSSLRVSVLGHLGFSFGPSIYEIQTNTSVSMLRPYWMEIVLAACVFVVPLCFGLFSRRRADMARDLKAWWLMTVMLVVPSLGTIAADFLTQMPRYLIVCLTPYVGFLAVGIGSLDSRFAVVSFLMITTVSMLSLANYYWKPQYSKEDARGASIPEVGLRLLVTASFIDRHRNSSTAFGLHYTRTEETRTASVY